MNSLKSKDSNPVSSTQSTAVTAGTTITAEQLAEEHFDYLYRYAARFFSSPETVEDLVQDTFVVAVSKLSSFEGRSSARTWLTGILKNKILDQITRTRDRKTDVLGDLTEEKFSGLFNWYLHWETRSKPNSWGASADQLVGQGQFLKVVRDCLERIPERTRQIFLLAELEDENRQELSNKFELSSTNIGVILYRARLSLQQCVKSNWKVD